MPQFSIKDLAKIVERESKVATYKFALLRATIEIIQEQDHYKRVHGDRVSFPMGLMILKWIRYYYPILSQNIRQGTSENVAFQSEFDRVFELYSGYPANADQLFYDLKNGIGDTPRRVAVILLIRKLRDIIAKNPMHFIGSSIGMGGELYEYERGSNLNINMKKIDLEWIINNLGWFYFPVHMHHELSVVGNFLTGTHSIIFKWAEFSSRLKGPHSIETSDMISLLKSDYHERDIALADKYYKHILENETLACVWSGREIRSRERMHIDHMIPFSVLRNNDLWNLLPATIQENSKKKDKIPSPVLLVNAGVKERIVDRWGDLYLRYGGQFRTEVQVALLGRTEFREQTWKNESYRRVSEMCHHMIEERGFEPWER